MAVLVQRPVTAPGAWPLIGHIARLAKDPLAFVGRLHDVAPVVRILLGPHEAFIVTRPDLVRRLLVADQDRFDKGGPVFDKMRLFLGNGLSTCPMADHSRQRALMQPGFHRTRIEHYADVVRDVLEEVTGAWWNGQMLRLEDEVHRVTALATTRSLVSSEQGLRAADQLAVAIPDIFQGLYWRMVIPSRLFPRIPLPVNRRFDRQTANVRRLVDDVVAHYRADGIDRGDLLSMLIPACETEQDPQQAIYDQAITILTAGVETAAGTIVQALRLLDQHPQYAQRLLDEADQALAGRAPGHADLPNLPYAHHVVTETLRLYPPTWLLSRVTLQHVDWNEGWIPAGSDVLFSPYALHRVAEVFPDPEAFDPDRWNRERVTTIQRQGFFALGAGRRKCIGDVFGINEAVIAVVSILSRWTLSFAQHPTTAKNTLRMLLMPPPSVVRVEAR
ncbi:cytochrome P450 [Streptomyces noursei]|uniref:cytochrome P450 n=1 Tax=Streptomyces noursei TaxID=1971 RepID=UPI0023B821CE|nr:cytochrome P450 [Streptomyces noursei]